ncbi:uncharacterized protein LOC109854174 isoform X2 [Pseudomyrmex gracilis]|uniref:uncharacterized protein LOC109854174 isoform X2 n=2 Tax=Pseudomyrmex gracilis TaxID=219809 RepID=UPI000995256F|nr:uncharacterized protein LOC109854174 isoform X2 [Pseudomyrmex gracilis]
MYYLSRPLPNIMVMPLVLLALFGWLKQNHIMFIWSSAAAIIIFRAELAILLGLFLLYDIAYQKLSVSRLLKIAIPAGILFLALTVATDSIFWKRLVWPEGEVFYFNTILNKSSEWGTSPFLWYFYSALPRGLAFSYFLIPLGIFWDARVRVLTVPAITFVALFSFLPHKELRFIIYVFPLLNVGAAAACHRIWENRAKTTWNGFLAVIILSHLALNIVFSMFLLCVAGSNYPGGLAIARLHRLEKHSVEPVHVHIDVLTAQTGVSRFTQTNSSWIYSKQENLTIDDPEMLQFTHLLVEAGSKYSPNLKPYLETHDIIDSIDGFSHITLNYNMLPPVRIKTKPTIFIMKRKPNIKYDFDKTRSGVSTKDLPKKAGNMKNIGLNISHEITKTIEPLFNDIMESLEEFAKPGETDKQNFSNIGLEEFKKSNNYTVEKAEKLNGLIDYNVTFMENITQKEDLNNLLTELKDSKTSFQDNLDDISDINKAKSENIKSKNEEEKIINEKSKVDLNIRQQSSSVKETLKKLIQEKILEVKQRKENNNEQKTTELPMKSLKKKGIAIQLPKRMKVLKQELKDQTIADKSATSEQKFESVKEQAYDENKTTKQIARKVDKTAASKLNISLEQIVQNEDITIKKENETDAKKADSQTFDESNAQKELSISERKTEDKDKEKNIKVSQSINARESIRNIINQFREFEKEFIYDDTNSIVPTTNDMNNANVDGDSYRTQKDIDSFPESKTQLMTKDARESLKEIIDQFKYIKHELTLEEDDRFDEIAAKYMEQPIDETLMQFNEALKTLMQRRKQTVPQKHASNLNYDNNYTSEKQRKLEMEKNTQEAIEQRKKIKTVKNSHKNDHPKIVKVKLKERDSDVNRPKQDPMITIANKYTNTLTKTEDTNNQRHREDTSNNVHKVDSERKKI